MLPLPVISDSLDKNEHETQSQFIASHIKSTGVTFAITCALALVFFVYIHPLFNNPASILWTITENMPSLPFLTSYAFIMAIFLPWITLYVRAARKANAAFFNEFASQNQYTYKPWGDPKSFSGAFGDSGHNRSVSQVIAGKYGDFPFRLFHYHFTINEMGRSEIEENLSIFELSFPGTLPTILVSYPFFLSFLDSKKFKIKDSFEPITLEGNFNQFFRVYAERGKETEALQFLAPDTMQWLLDHGKDFEGAIEFNQNKIYIYFPLITMHATRKALITIFTFASAFLEEATPALKRIAAAP